MSAPYKQRKALANSYSNSLTETLFKGLKGLRFRGLGFRIFSRGLRKASTKRSKSSAESSLACIIVFFGAISYGR